LKIPNECEELTNNPEIQCEENGVEIIFKNDKQKPIRKIEIDDCVIKEGVRCDWLILDETDTEYFVELKSKHGIKHGIDQLRNSIKILCSNLRDPNRMSFLIHRRRPGYGTKIQTERLRFEREFNSSLIVKKTPYEYNLE